MCAAAKLTQNRLELCVLVVTLNLLKFGLKAAEHGFVALKPAFRIVFLELDTLRFRPEVRC